MSKERLWWQQSGLLSKMKIVVASKNKGKIEEIRSYLLDTSLDSGDSNLKHLEVVSVDEYPDLLEIVEDGQTFAENAIKKAVIVAEYTKEIALADDSGLVVDCLNGEPGVLSARFGNKNLDDKGRNQLLLKRIKNVCNQSLKTARFICALSIATPEGMIETIQGSCEGIITDVPRGEHGFGYDPIFIPDGYTSTFAELGIEIKNKLSHRAKALEKARDVLKRMGRFIFV
jgi:XTP/dITP diphosphohydrolase